MRLLIDGWRMLLVWMKDVWYLPQMIPNLRDATNTNATSLIGIPYPTTELLNVSKTTIAEHILLYDITLDIAYIQQHEAYSISKHFR